MTTSLSSVDAAAVPPVFDGHVDLVYALRQAEPMRTWTATRGGPLTPAAFARGGVRVVNSALYCSDQYNGPDAARHLQEQAALSILLTDELTTIRSRADLDCAWTAESGTAKLLLLENADALVDLDISLVVSWGVRTIGLTHAGSNRLADGNAVASPAGLRPPARRLLPELARAGLAIDLAHLAEPGFRELLDAFEGPVCCTHTGFRRFCDTPRNLSDDQVRAVHARDGLVGIAFAPEMLTTSGPVDIGTVFRQLDDLVQRFGWEGFGLGSDLGGYPGACAGLEDHGCLPLLTARLAEAGYPETAIRGLCGENWLNFYRRILPAREN